MDRRGAGRALLAGALLPVARPRSAWGQGARKVAHVGYLSAPSRESVASGVDAFRRRLRELGWNEGDNLVLEFRWAEGNLERLPELAAELVRLKMDVIVAPAGSAAVAAKRATDQIPIVMIFPNDPVELGLVASLARPGGNITGTTFTPGADLFGKQVQILREVIPHATRLAILWNPADPESEKQVREVELVARSLALRPQRFESRGPEQFDGAFAAMGREHAEGLVVAGGSTFLVHRVRLADLARAQRLPTMCSYRENVEAGALLAYAVNMASFVGRSAEYVDKILRGARPADLPVERPSKFELIINLRTAQALGIAIPQSLLLRADDVLR